MLSATLARLTERVAVDASPSDVEFEPHGPVLSRRLGTAGVCGVRVCGVAGFESLPLLDRRHRRREAGGAAAAGGGRLPRAAVARVGGGDAGEVAGRRGGAVRAGRRLERRRGRALAGGAVEGVQHVQRAAVPHRQRVGERDPLGRHVTSEERLKVLVVHVVQSLVVHRVRAPREQEGEEREEPRQTEEDDHLAVREGLRPHRRPALAAPVVGGLPARAVEQRRRRAA